MIPYSGGAPDRCPTFGRSVVSKAYIDQGGSRRPSNDEPAFGRGGVDVCPGFGELGIGHAVLVAAQSLAARGEMRAFDLGPGQG